MAVLFIIIGILMLIVYLRWIIVALIALLFTVGGGLITGIIAGFITYYLLKLIGWWLVYCVASKIADDTKHPGKK